MDQTERLLAEVLENLRELQQLAQRAGAGDAAKTFQSALRNAEKGAQWVRQYAAGSAAVHEQIKKALEQALASPKRERSIGTADSDEVFVSYKAHEIPKYPPDDDGPGDAAYWRMVREEEQEAERIVDQVLAQFRANGASKVVRHAEKGFIHIRIRLT